MALSPRPCSTACSPKPSCVPLARTVLAMPHGGERRCPHAGVCGRHCVKEHDRWRAACAQPACCAECVYVVGARRSEP
eukprot:183598-Pelagomonas_calceolata.AAC.1